MRSPLKKCWNTIRFPLGILLYLCNGQLQFPQTHVPTPPHLRVSHHEPEARVPLVLHHPHVPGGKEVVGGPVAPLVSPAAGGAIAVRHAVARLGAERDPTRGEKSLLFYY